MVPYALSCERWPTEMKLMPKCSSVRYMQGQWRELQLLLAASDMNCNCCWQQVI